MGDSVSTEDFIAQLIAPMASAPTLPQPSVTNPAFTSAPPTRPPDYVAPPPLARPNPDIAGQLSTLSSFNDQITATQNALIATLPNPAAAYNALVASTNQVIEGQKLLAAEKLRQEAEVANKDARLQAILGNRLGIGNTSIMDIAQQIATTSKDIMSKDAQLGRDASVGFFDNPVQWLTNQFTLPARAKQLLAEEQQVDTRLAILDTYTKAAEDGHKNNLLAVQADTATLMRANSLIIEGSERAKLFNANMEMIRTVGSNVNVRLAALGSEFQRAVAINNATQQSTAQSIALYDLDLNVQKRDLQAHQVAVGDYETALRARESAQTEVRNGIATDIAAMQSTDLRIKLQGQQNLNEKLKQVSTLLNIAPLNTENFNLLPKPIQDVVGQLMILQSPGEDARYGKDMLDGLKNLDKFPAALASAAETTRAGLLNLYSKAVIEVFGGPQGLEAQGKAKDSPVNNVKIINSMLKQLNVEMKNVPDSGSVFSPSPLKAISSMKSLEGNVITETLQPFLASDPNHALKAQEALDAAVSLVIKGKVSPEKATADLVQLYKSAMLDANQRNKLQQFGVSGFNDQTGFNVTVRTSAGLLSGSRTVDMTNSAAVYSLIQRATLNEQRATEALGVTLP